MSTQIDARIRSFLQRLDDAAPVPRPFEDLSNRWPHADLRRTGIRSMSTHVDGRRRLTTVAALGVAALGVAGVAFVTSFVERESPAASPADPRQIANPLPDGWNITGAVDPKGGQEPPSVRPAWVLYATPDTPGGPVVAIIDGEGSGADPSDASPTQLQLSDGRDAVLGDGLFGARWIDVEFSPGSWTGLLARNVSDERLIDLAERLHVEAGQPPWLDIDPSVGDLALVGAGNPLWSPFLLAPVSATTNVPEGVSVVGYGPDDGPTEVIVTASQPTAFERASLGLIATVEPLDDGSLQVTFGADGSTGVYRGHGDLVIFGIGAASRFDVVRQLVDSTTSVAPSRWADLTRRSPFVESDIEAAIPATTTATGAPHETDAEPTTLHVAVTTDDEDMTTYKVDYPDGTTSSVSMHVSGRTLLATGQLGKGASSTAEVQVNNIGGLTTTVANAGDDTIVVAAAPADSAATQLRITAGSTTYLVELHPLAAGLSSLRVASLVIPHMQHTAVSVNLADQ